MIRRPFTPTESARLVCLAHVIRRGGEPDLAALLERLAGGDDAALPDLHDCLNVMGRPELADAVRRLALAD